VLILGFVGPAVGTVLAFIPTVIGYCYYISKASGVPLGRIYPFVGYMKVLLLGLVAASGAVAFKVSVTLPAAIKLGGEAMILLLTFGLIGTALGMIRRSDWRFLVCQEKLAEKPSTSHYSSNHPTPPPQPFVSLHIQELGDRPIPGTEPDSTLRGVGPEQQDLMVVRFKRRMVGCTVCIVQNDDASRL
jgi:hypothetical protein